MDLELSDDQVALRDGIASMLGGRFDIARIRAGFDRAMWDELGAAGVFSLGADGFGWADRVVVFEQLGVACVPGPLVAGSLANGLVDGIVGGIDRPSPGERAFVEHLDALDHVVVLDDDGVWALDARAITGDLSPWPLDPLTPVTRVAALGSGERIGDAALAHAWVRHGAALTAAIALGLAQRCTDLAVEYAATREQFDRPIGSFQAIKHLLADMLVRTELARAAVYAAGAHLDDPDLPGLDRAVAGAKVLAGEAAIANGKSATQVFGGMGFTWEVDVHLYLKRAWVLDTHFGSCDHWSDSPALVTP
ncbi:MAG TPA: acyl-CoA dehydrogenase family protein [Acidimicrobiia bacterium]